MLHKCHLSCQASEQCKRLASTHTCTSTHICICIRANIRQHSGDCKTFPNLFTVSWILMLSAFFFFLNATYSLWSLSLFNELPYNMDIHIWRFWEWKHILNSEIFLFLFLIVSKSIKVFSPISIQHESCLLIPQSLFSHCEACFVHSDLASCLFLPCCLKSLHYHSNPSLSAHLFPHVSPWALKCQSTPSPLELQVSMSMCVCFKCIEEDAVWYLERHFHMVVPPCSRLLLPASASTSVKLKVYQKGS